MNVITDSQWADWRINPVTQALLKYITCKKQEIARIKHNVISGPAEEINPYQISVLNGIEQTCNQILNLDLGTLTTSLHAAEEEAREYRQMMKDSFGVSL